MRWRVRFSLYRRRPVRPIRLAPFRRYFSPFALSSVVKLHLHRGLGILFRAKPFFPPFVLCADTACPPVRQFLFPPLPPHPLRSVAIDDSS